MAKKKQEIVVANNAQVDENQLFTCISAIIENRKSRAGAYANQEITLMYWEIGQYINTIVLDSKRAEYGRQIFSTLSRNLPNRYEMPKFLRRCRNNWVGSIEGD